MHIIVVGCGRVGSSLARALEVEGHKVVVIDKDPTAFERLSPGFKGIRIQGDALDRDTLYRAGIEHADAIAAVTNSDALNATMAIIARDRFKIPKLAIRVFDPADAEVYRRLGVPTISPIEWGANFMKDVLCHPELHPRLTIGNGEVQVIELAVPLGLVGRPVGQINVPRQVMVVAIMRQGKAIIPYESMVFQEDDILTLAVSNTAIGRIEELLAH
jgi:trk system potassium uptake protein TrkA